MENNLHLPFFLFCLVPILRDIYLKTTFRKKFEAAFLKALRWEFSPCWIGLVYLIKCHKPVQIQEAN